MRMLLALAAVFAANMAAAEPSSVPPAPASAPLSDDDKRLVVTHIAAALDAAYIYPALGREAGAKVEKALSDGAYAAIGGRAEFAARLTDDLQAVTHDKHMRVVDPTAGPGPGGPRPKSRAGFVHVERLQGNIGYIVLAGFPDPAMMRDVADRAMTDLASTDALIIDNRENGGGSPDSVAHVASFFFDPATPVHINDLIWRQRGTETYKTQSFFTGPTPVHYLGKPVVIIASRRTFSGGEEFTYDLKVLKRATIVGETTGGGANPGGGEPLGAGLFMFVPTGRAENPITKTSWEGVGVAPDIPAPPQTAFAVAYRTALAGARRSAARAKVMAALAAKGGEADAWSEASLLTVGGPTPGSEAALRSLIEATARGDVDFAIFEGPFADVAREAAPRARAFLAGMGALQSMTYVETDGLGSDRYRATFSHGTMDWTIYLNAAGKIPYVFSPDIPPPPPAP